MATALPQTGSVIARWSADDITPQGDNTNLSTWTDSVGSIAASQATSGLQPKYRTNRIGSKPSVSFPGGQVLQVGRPSALVTAINSQAITLFVVWRDLATGSTAFLFDFGSNDTGSALMTDGTYVGRFSDARSGTIPHPGMNTFNTLGWTEDISYVNGGITGLERVFVNGGCVATSAAISSGLGAAGNIAIGADYANAAFVNVNAEYFDIVIWNRTLTTTELIQCHMWACDKYGQAYPLASKDRMHAFPGDSITAGVGATNTAGTYPYLAAQSLGLSYGQWTNLGIGGDTIANMGTRAPYEIDNIYALTGKPVAVAAFEWYNQAAASPTPEAASVTYLNARRSSKVKVAFGTSTDTNATTDINREAYNRYFDANNNSVTMDAYVPIHNDPNIGVETANVDFPANFYDGVHLTSAGNVYLAALFVAGLQKLSFPSATSYPQRARRRHRKSDTYDFSAAGWFSLGMVAAAQFDKDMVGPTGGAAAALQSAVTAQTTVSAGLTTAIQLAAAPAAQTTVTAALSTSIRLAATPAAQTTVTAALTTGIQLAAAVSDVVTVTAAATTAIKLAATPQAVTTVTAALTTGIQVATAVQAQTTLTAALTAGSSLASTIQAQTTVTAALSTSIRLASSVQAQTTVSATLWPGFKNWDLLGNWDAWKLKARFAATDTSAAALAAAAQALTTLTAALTTQIRLASAVSAQSTVTAGLTTGISLASGVQAVTTTTAALTTAIRLASTVQSVVTVSATFVGSGAQLAADTQSRTSVTADLTTSVRLASQVIAQAQVSAALTTQIALAAIAQAQCTSSGSLSTQIRMLASSQGQCTVSGTLSLGVFIPGNTRATQVRRRNRSTLAISAG